MGQDRKAAFLQMWSLLREPLIFPALIEQFQSHSPISLESVQTEYSSCLLCPTFIPGERIESREKKICINQGHPGVVATVKAGTQLFISDSVNILLCHHWHCHHQFVYAASIMDVMKYGPTPISCSRAGMQKWHCVAFRTEKMVNKCFLYKGSPFTTRVSVHLSQYHRWELWLADKRVVVGSKEDKQEGQVHGRTGSEGVRKSRQTLLGPALSLLIESTDFWQKNR